MSEHIALIDDGERLLAKLRAEAPDERAREVGRMLRSMNSNDAMELLGLIVQRLRPDLLRRG